MGERYLAHFAAGDWDGMAEILADDFSSEDRRRVVGAGVRHGRDAEIVDMRAIADLGLTNVTSTAIATRGERLVLSRVRFTDRDHGPETVLTEVLIILEIDADERIVATVTFDLDEFDAAFEELDARYLAGEAADRAHTWSAVTAVYAAINRHEQPAQTKDSVCIDHRPLVPIETVELATWIRGVWDLTPDLSNYIETVNRLSNFGAVLTHAAHGTSQEGFGAEWRLIAVLMFEGDRIGRLEIFDEADIAAALARFDELHPQAPRLENAASRMYDRYNACLVARDWDAMAEMLADDICGDDRRRVVSGGITRGRDAQAANSRAIADVGVNNIESFVIATRGESLVLARTRVSGGQRPEAFGLELLNIIEIDGDSRIAAGVSFDLDDIDAAFAELDARYLAGEAVAHARTWSLIARTYAGFNQHEFPSLAADSVSVDHRSLVTNEAVDLAAATRSVWEVAPDLSVHIEAVHRLSQLGAVLTHVGYGTSPDGFDAEWRMTLIYMVQDDMLSSCEIFDEADLDAALARFEELQPQTRRLENAAGRIVERYQACFSTHDWTALAELLADDIVADDRRRVVNAGIRRGRDVYIADNRAAVEIGADTISLSVVATRGERLALAHARAFNRGSPPGEVGAEWLGIAEIDADERIVAIVVFDLDDIDAAHEELDARYLAGEAAAYAHTWSVNSRLCAGFNRGELPATTPGWIYIDHRPLVTIEANDALASMRVGRDLTPDIRVYVEAVHRLSDLGAVVTAPVYGSSHEGFAAEWRMIDLFTVEGDLINRLEIFDEADLDAALARFEELQPQARRLENAATQVAERLRANFAARDWTARAELLADDCSVDDRRRVVNAGRQHGRDADIANMRAIAAVGVANIALTTIATRGERLALSRARMSGRDQRPEAFYTETLTVLDIDTDNRAAAQVVFDPDDIDAALAELDSRYLAGDAAAHAHTWTLVTRAYAALNRRQLPETTVDWVNVDHRRLAPIAAGDLGAYLLATWDLSPQSSIRIEAVHRLSEVGAVVTQVVEGTSQEGFDAEWRTIDLATYEGDKINRTELFDEEDLDAALARFDELQPQAPRLENAASQNGERVLACFAARDWAAMAELLAEDISADDRRRVVNAGNRHGRDADIANMRAIANLGVVNIASTFIATRGERLALSRSRMSGRDQGPEAFYTEALTIVEVDTDNRAAARVVFDPDDIDAALAELDARYLAGEAAAHAHTWSSVTGAYAALSRHELLSTTQDWVNVDHHRLVRAEPGHLTAYAIAAWKVSPDMTGYIEAVHRLSNFGTVVTLVVHGTSQEGFDAEWREIELLMFEGDRINRLEIFDEADLDAALAHFEELHPQARRLENAASRAEERFFAYFGARNWAAMAEILADDTFIEDRHRVVNVGFWEGRDVVIANLRALADAAAAESITLAVVATRGERLVLTRMHSPNGDPRYGEFDSEMLIIAEIDTDDRIAAQIAFELDDIDAAFAELDARYLAGEAATHAHTWSLMMQVCAAHNRHEILPNTMADWVNVDHRRGIAFAPGDMIPYVRATWDIAPDVQLRHVAVHRLTNLGAVITQSGHGTSRDGFDAEWQEIGLFAFEGDLLSSCEIFDEADLDAALAQFDELSQPARLVENAATRVYARLQTHFAARDWDALTETLADGHYTDDRRRVVGGIRHTRDSEIRSIQATADLGVTDFAWAATATRGRRLALCRTRGATRGPEAFDVELLQVVEIDTDERIASLVTFDLDDMDAAIAELDARYLAGEAAPHAHTWSVIANANAAFNRHEMPPATSDSVNVDHRRGIAFAPGGIIRYIRATWDVAPDIRNRLVAVHRLSDLGAVVTQTTRGISQEGFEAEWREIALLIVEGDLINRIEVFDEADIDAALARFDELHPQAPRLENAATQVDQRFWAYFTARNWDAMAELTAQDIFTDDRRRVVNAGVQHGRDDHIAEMRAAAEVGFEKVASTAMATRGASLALTHIRAWNQGMPTEEVSIEVLNILEIDAENRVVARLAFDVDEIDAAFAELEARYLAGEAAAYAPTWSVIARTYAAFNRHEFPSTTTGSVYVDHRPLLTNDASDLAANIRATWDLMDVSTYIAESVHRLSELGAVVTQTLTGTSKDGLDVEYRMIDLFTVERGLLNRVEVFDAADLDVALARFDELHPPAPRLQNAATRAIARFWTYFEARDWDAMAEIWTDDYCTYDRRKVVNAGVLRGRAVHMTNMRAVAEVGFESLTSTVIATRGQRLALIRIRSSMRGSPPGEVSAEAPSVVEIDADGRLAASVQFDSDDIDAAFEELEARYLAGEAPAHAHTWSVITRGYAAFNRHELPPTAPDLASVDHRRGIAFAPGGMIPYIHATWDITADVNSYAEAVHRLTNLGAVITQRVHATSQDSFDAEWREIALLIVEGGLMSRIEMFDEADLDAAFARFDELSRPPLLDNAATRTWARQADAFNRRDVDGFFALMTADGRFEDRRKGLRVVLEGPARRKAVRAIFDEAPSSWRMQVEPIATRGSRLELTRECYCDTDEADRPIAVEFLHVMEVNDSGLVQDIVSFDADDINAAFEELDARYLAGEAAAHARTWAVIAEVYATFNRHELPPATPDWVTVDHRPLATFEFRDLTAFFRATWDLTPQASIYVETVHRLSNLGAVVTHAVHGTSREGFEAEWRQISVATVEGDLIDRCEIFDEADIDAALAKFDELSRPPVLENAATRLWIRLADAFNRRDVDGFLALTTADMRYEDRRKGLRDAFEGAQHAQKAVRAMFEASPTSWRLAVDPIAIRGSRLSLIRCRYRDTDFSDQPIAVELLEITEVSPAGLMCDTASFDPDDINGAFAELTDRWIASGEVEHPEIIKSAHRLTEATNRHDRDEIARRIANATFFNHRQLASPDVHTIGDFLSSSRAVASLIPDFWIEPAEIVAHSAMGVVAYQVLKGTSADGVAIEIPLVVLLLFDGDRVTRLEVFDADQRDQALARFEELNPSH